MSSTCYALHITLIVTLEQAKQNKEQASLTSDSAELKPTINLPLISSTLPSPAISSFDAGDGGASATESELSE